MHFLLLLTTVRLQRANVELISFHLLLSTYLGTYVRNYRNKALSKTSWCPALLTYEKMWESIGT